MNDIYKYLAKNCSNLNLFYHRNYFVRHPTQFRRILHQNCDWSSKWAMDKIEIENERRSVSLEKVRIISFMSTEISDSNLC